MQPVLALSPNRYCCGHRGVGKAGPSFLALPSLFPHAETRERRQTGHNRHLVKDIFREVKKVGL